MFGVLIFAEYVPASLDQVEDSPVCVPLLVEIPKNSGSMNLEGAKWSGDIKSVHYS